MNNRLSRWWYICICLWRELAFHPDRNEPNQVVASPLISKLGRVIIWISLFHIPHKLPEVHQWFGDDHLLCFVWDVLSRVDVHVPSFYAIRYSHWVLLLFPLKLHSCFWWVPCQRNGVFLTWASQQYMVLHSRISLYPCSLLWTCFLTVQRWSMKKAACLPLECIAHFGFAMKLLCSAWCYIQ